MPEPEMEPEFQEPQHEAEAVLEQFQETEPERPEVEPEAVRDEAEWDMPEPEFQEPTVAEEPSLTMRLYQQQVLEEAFKREAERQQDFVPDDRRERQDRELAQARADIRETQDARQHLAGPELDEAVQQAAVAREVLSERREQPEPPQREMPAPAAERGYERGMSR
jgi:hypothetical protein